jgi:hypothetical protein
MKALVLTLTSDDDVGTTLDNDLNVVFKYIPTVVVTVSMAK